MCDVKEVEAKATAGAPEREIEVTPEMIEAGLERFPAGLNRLLFPWAWKSDS